jgi:outer membrane protein assembly factor BamB
MKRVIVIAAVLLLVSSAFGAVLTVPGMYSTIQSAIDAASTGDTVIISPGTYTGAGNYNLTFSGKAITVTSVNPDDWNVIESTVIDCNRLGRGFTIDANGILEGLTITHGSFSQGGGIVVLLVTNGSPLIRNCNITDNNATTYGGGIYSLGSPTIIGCTISGNYAAWHGGGIYCSGSTTTVTIIDCNISGNTSVSRGGGIYAMGTFIVDNCIIVNNQSAYGGGVWSYNTPGTPKIDRSIIIGNIALSSPGGGGIFLENDTININNSIVAGNFSQTNGGGLYVSNSATVIAAGCTIAGNAASNLGGGAFFASSGKLSGFNSIFWDNNDSTGVTTSAQISPLPATPGQTLLFSCIADPLSYFGGANNGNIDDDPMFVRETNDGGDGWGVGGNDDYGDLHLRPGSPCIDAGNSLYVPDANATDIDGEPRLTGSAVDMGADEYGKMIVVTKPAGGEVWATGSKHPIKWDKYGVGSVDILFSSDSGDNWETIADGIADTNSYLWQLPDDVDSNQCIISVVPGNGDANVISEASDLFTVSWYPARPAVPAQWLRRGLLPEPNLNENKGPRIGCVKWVFQTDGPVSSQVAVTRPYWDSYWIYIGAEDGNLYCLDDLGELNWVCDINTAVVGSPAVGYYWMVYAAGQNGRLYAIDDYGDISWTHKTDAPVYSTPVVGYDGKIYVCSEDGLIYALDADGSELWTFATKGPANLDGAIFATPVVDKNGTVYVGGLYEPNLYALDANSGNIKWVCNFGAIEPNKGQIVTSPAIGPNGIIYQTLVRDPNLYAVDPCTGNILWSASLRLPLDMNSSGWSSPVVGPDGTIYVSFDDPYLRAVEPNGAIKWVTRLGLIGGFTLALDRDGLIYAASDDNYVCVVDSNGLEVSRFKGNNWLSFPAIAEDGTLIVSDANNRVWAITSNSCEGQSPVLHTPADLRADNMVDFIDLAVLAESWRDCTDPFNTLCSSGNAKYGLYSPGDVDRDAYINIWDLNALVEEWLTQSDFE